MTRPEVSVQLTAIAELRWRMFVNGLRSKRGKMELASRIIVTLGLRCSADSAALPPPPDFPGILSRRGTGRIPRASSCGRSFSSGKFFP